KKIPIFLSLPPDAQISTATLIHGERRRALTLDEFHNGFESPLVDPAWPDDSLIELELVVHDPAPATSP
ncbi:MAG TPA: hypothetical protein VGC21_23710, partial [Telluria sp.]